MAYGSTGPSGPAISRLRSGRVGSRLGLLLLIGALVAAACGDSAESAVPNTITASTAGQFALDIPSLRIDERLFEPAAGTSRFDPRSKVRRSDGDWHSVETTGGLVIPVPSGWATLEVPDNQETFIEFAPDADPLTGEGDVYLFFNHGQGYQGDADLVVADWLDTFSSFADSWEGSTVQGLGDFDDGLFGYAAAEFTPSELDPEEYGLFLGFYYPAMPNDSAVMMVVAAGGDRQAETIYVIAAATAKSDWDAYEPILRAILDRTFTTAGEYLGIDIPDGFSFNS